MTRLIFTTITLVAWLTGVGGLYLTGTKQLSFPFTSPILWILAGQAFAIRMRESNMRPQTRWRFPYATIIFIGAAAFISAVHVSPTLDPNPIRTETQAILGGYLISQFLALPALISCSLQRSGNVKTS